MPTALVVDDDPSIREVFRCFLIRHGYTVHTAADGPEALRLLRVTRPQVVLLDHNLPTMTGLDVLRRLRVFAPDTAVCVISGALDAVIREAAQALGALACLEKPVELPALERCLALRPSRERGTAAGPPARPPGDPLPPSGTARGAAPAPPDTPGPVGEARPSSLGVAPGDGGQDPAGGPRAEERDRRGAPRTPLGDRPAAQVRGLRGVRLLDLSATGAQIEHLDVVRVDAAYTLDLPPPFRVLSLPTHVVWCTVIGVGRQGTRVGDSPLVARSGLRFAPLTGSQHAALTATLPHRAATSPSG